MDIWIVRDGEKAGPFQDFEIRRKIGTREIDGSTAAWYEGMSEWKRLEEIPLFQNEFAPKIPEAVVSEAVFGAPAPEPDQPAYLRRFFARWFDLYTYAALWWLTMWALGKNIGEISSNPLILMTQYIPWFILEAVLLHYFGSTPGKWLLGLQVRNQDDSKLALSASSRRSLRVFLVGIGMGVSVFSLVCQGVSLLLAKRFGNTMWDLAGNHRVTAADLNPLKIIAFIVLFYGALQLQGMILWPYMIEVVKSKCRI